MEYTPTVYKMQEEELYHWWQYYGRSGKTIYSQGRRLRVLNSGRLNTSRGPDFTSARFELDGIVYQGDVECHCKSSDWYAHRHHLDKTYRQVVLHLVGRPEDSTPVKSLWSPLSICTLPLPKPLISADAPEKYCQPANEFQQELKSNLTQLAINRFDQKVNMFMKALNEQNDYELFYVYFFRTMGYPANANTFQLLAEQLNWTWLMEHKTNFSEDYRKLFAVYAGLAGFIFPPCSDGYSQNIKHLYNNYKYLLPGHTFDPDAWQYAGVRPNNHPHFRLATAVQILQNYDYNLFDIIITVLQSRRNCTSALKEIISIFQLQPDAYWATHYALGKTRNESMAAKSIGQARIIELLINVILPLAAARACQSGSEGFFAYLQSFYLLLPLKSSYACFRNEIAWFDDCFKIWPAQAVTQSLLLLQSEYCHRLLCSQCPVRRYPAYKPGKIIDNKIKNI